MKDWFDTSPDPEIARVVADAEAQARRAVPPPGVPDLGGIPPVRCRPCPNPGSPAPPRRPPPRGLPPAAGHPTPARPAAAPPPVPDRHGGPPRRGRATVPRDGRSRGAARPPGYPSPPPRG